MNNIKYVVESGECCGCEACINTCPVDAIQYSKDKYGFAIPTIDDDKCVFCGMCSRSCPSVQVSKNSPLSAYAAVSIDKQKRFASSSGGVFGVIANRILELGGVVFGCTIDDKLKVRHIAIETESDLPKIQKSKYVQSRMTDVYAQAKQILSIGRTVLFSGTPCQVAALNNFLNENEKKNLLTVDIVCHGVPSQELFDDYLSMLSNQKGKIHEYQFRAKKRVDGGMQWYSSYVFGRNKKRIVFDWTEDSYNYMYMMMYTNRDSCYACKYASMDRPSDITLCDFWHWDKYHPSFPSGTTMSGVLVNTRKGKLLFEEISGLLCMEPAKVENIAAANGALCQPSGDIIKRNEILSAWKDHGYRYLDRAFAKKYRGAIVKGMIRRSIPQSVYTFISELKRSVLKK